MECLKTVVFQLPDRHPAFGEKLFRLLLPFGRRDGDRLVFQKSDPAFLPDIAFTLADVPHPRVAFDWGDGKLELLIANATGREWPSPEAYQPIGIDETAARLEYLGLVCLDHVGFNLPWVDGIHPEILLLRKELAPRSACYRFPTGQSWNFVLPATEDEIRKNVIDLGTERRPKLEIVSFEKCSTPLVQVDVSVRRGFEEITAVFPEGIADTNLRNVWVYVQNSYGIDLCLVVGEHREGDWSAFFQGHRLS